MSNAMWSKERARKIKKRLVISGTLTLETPAHFGNGDGDESVLTLQTDSLDPTKPLLPGPSIAGALRAYLRTWKYGYNTAEKIEKNDQEESLIAQLFGAPLGGLTDIYGGQSTLLIDDAVGDAKGIDHRDGVRINPSSRTPIDKGLYTFQTWAAGTTFPLRMELLITEKLPTNIDENNLKYTLATALTALENGEITLGARKKRGLGRGRVESWTVWEYDMEQSSHIQAWLKGEPPIDGVEIGKAAAVLGGLDTIATDKRQRFTIDATFDIDGSVLIRSGSDVADMAHLKSGEKSVLSGTSLTGAIRSRARKIMNTLGKPPRIVEDMFGRDGDVGKHKPSPSRVIIKEAEIRGGVNNMVQSRVSIDRFTGGALDTALFTQQPQWGGRVKLNIELRNPQAHEIGLLLLVLKDLWTGDLPIGGESSVGRGRLCGLRARLNHTGKSWVIDRAADNGIEVISGDSSNLATYVKVLLAYLGGSIPMDRTIHVDNQCQLNTGTIDAYDIFGDKLPEKIPDGAWLLAHADDGLIWGEIKNGELEIKNQKASFREDTLQQARLFWETGEVFIWRDGDGHLQARRIDDEVAGNSGIVAYYDESQILWGDTAQAVADGWTRMTDGAQGLDHTVPLDISSTKQGVRPLRLKIRHYLKEHDDTGALYVAVSRLVSLHVESK